MTHRLLLAALLAMLATAAHAQGSPRPEPAPGLPTISMPLSMPEAAPHTLGTNDVSELQETRYTQKHDYYNLGITPTIFVSTTVTAIFTTSTTTGTISATTPVTPTQP